MANNSETINNQPITAASIDMDTAQEISHDLALTSSAVPLQQLSSFSDPVNLPHIQKNDDDIILTHDQNSNIDLDEDILMAERNNLSLLDNLILPRNDQCTGILGSESIFCERQRGTFDSVQMIRTATTTSSSSSTFSTVSQQSTTDAISEMPICLDQQQFAFHQQQDQLQNKFRPTMSTPSFLKHSQQQQGESVMITITPLSSLIDTSTGNLLLNPTSTIINNNNTKHITTTATTADSMNNISASTVTRIITCFNGSECDCPGCFVHLDNNNIYASSAITNTTVADQQSSFYLQQQQSFVQPYHYPLSSSTTSASSNYSSSDEDERRYG
ncbi:hypothetical protein BDF20DRAFT_900986 [Mycotypha africana]|uniref:uncharacterized protein n=1 Tax=Mycotypha africana TaxID=64632 RepID=UPI0023010808|nr:uncharacterized protein BDF20DRAFT_900986 [Mycotypha africana]KAI8967426.1 hypothetical protein BDF20DRAFT_900986 [Mycotypha africana]